MSYRIHTADAGNVAVFRTTVRELDEQHGYEHSEDEAGDLLLVLDDGSNQEALALTGSRDSLRELAQRILTACADDAAGDPHLLLEITDGCVEVDAEGVDYLIIDWDEARADMAGYGRDKYLALLDGDAPLPADKREALMVELRNLAEQYGVELPTVTRSGD